MNKNWSNTALVAYSALPKLVNDIDFAVSTRVNSGFQSVHLKNGVTTYDLIGEIIKLNDWKRKLVNLRIIVASAMEKLTDSERMILLSRMFRKHTFQQISEDTAIPLRTVFRRFDSAQKHFASSLEIMGFGEDWFEREYAEVEYLKKIHERIDTDKYFIAKNS